MKTLPILMRRVRVKRRVLIQMKRRSKRNLKKWRMMTQA
jgi:hypothetical protein